MLTLYHGSGASGFDIISPHLNHEEYKKLKDNIIRLLTAKKQLTEIKYFQTFNFELSNGTNYFNDEFLVLHAKISVENYVKLTEFKNINSNLENYYSHISNAFTELGYFIRFISVFIDQDNNKIVVDSPEPKTNSLTVQIALKDAETLFRTSGAQSAIDRVHTAIHGYLKQICNDNDIKYEKDPSLTTLFGLIRPMIQPSGMNNNDVIKILRSSAVILEAINNIRNKASMAHPNEILLDEDEAILAINSTRTLLHYLDAKLKDR